MEESPEDEQPEKEQPEKEQPEKEQPEEITELPLKDIVPLIESSPIT